EEIVTQGRRGARFYLIDRGEIEVIEDGVRSCVQGPGESFGEIALLRDVPRTATVRATRATRLLALERDRFIPAVTGQVRSRQAARLGRARARGDRRVQHVDVDGQEGRPFARDVGGTLHSRADAQFEHVVHEEARDAALVLPGELPLAWPVAAEADLDVAAGI